MVTGSQPNAWRREQCNMWSWQMFQAQNTEYLKDKINELATHSKNKNIKQFYRE
jgi:hypothetical protein